MKMNPKIEGSAYSQSLEILKHFLADYHWEKNVDDFHKKIKRVHVQCEYIKKVFV